TLGIVQPFSLYHFVVSKDGASSFTEHFSGDIAWFGRSVLGAMHLNPAIVIPQVCNLLSDRSEALPSPSTPTPVPQSTWSANREFSTPPIWSASFFAATSSSIRPLPTP